MSEDCFLLHHVRLVSLDGAPGYAVIEAAAVAVAAGRIAWAGRLAELPGDWQGLPRIDGQGALLTPGLVDCHTHLVFAGDRSTEFEQRLGGASYESIARSGGGIQATVRATRQADEQQLFDESLPRALALVDSGVTTLEIKSGYGLEAASEAKMLRVARRIGEALGIEVRTSYLAAHALPPEFSGRAEDYLEAICGWLPDLQQQGLVDAVDAFCEHIAFSPQQVRRLFTVAQGLGLPVKLHADQLSDSGGAALVAAFGGLSADHVEYSSAEAVQAMARAGSVAVLLPGSFLCLGETTRPPIAEFRRHGVAMAVSTDLNPGTSPLCSLPLAMGLACALFRLSPEEALRGATEHAARALGLADRGRIAAGLRADLVLWPLRDPAGLSYWLGAPRPQAVYAAGRRVGG